MKLQETTKEEKILYEGHILKMHVDTVVLENGRIVKRECVDHPGGVSVAALTEKNEMLFVRQFRYPYRQVVLEAPAGKLEPGEDPFEAVKRELREETGSKGKQYLELGEIFPSPGYTNERLHLYACRIDSTGEQDLDEDEFLEVERIPIEKAEKMVEQGKIPDAKTQVLILRVLTLLKNKKI